MVIACIGILGGLGAGCSSGSATRSTTDSGLDAGDDAATGDGGCLPPSPECALCTYNAGHDCVGPVCKADLYCAPSNTPGEPPGYGSCTPTKPCGASCTTNRECASNVCASQYCQ